MTEYDAVVFDLDGTLCVADQDDEDIHDAIFERVGREELFEPTDLYAVDITTLPDVESDRDHYAKLYRAAAEEAGADPEEGVLDALAEATLDVYDSTLVSFREGAREALTYASERYAVGLLTNGTEDTQGAKLDRLGIGDTFDAAVLCGAGTDYPSKPDPKPFAAVLDGLGVVPGNAVYVGDRPDGDVAGASSAGMDSMWVPTGDPPADPEPEPTYLLKSPAALSEVL